jgi:TolB-like protein/DNA-binding SARP family transcriptional activator
MLLFKDHQGEWATMSDLNLQLLGGFEARTADGEPLSFSTKKTKALLAYLTAHPGTSHSRSVIASLLWGNSAEEQARASLRQTLADLRKALAPTGREHLVVKEDLVSIDPASVEVDTAVVETLAANGSPDGLERVCDLYQGEFLSGLDLREEEFNDWLRVERARLHGLATDALRALLAHCEANDQIDRGIHVANRLVEIDPLQETAHRSLMRSHLRQGERALALRQYEICREALMREVDSEPDEATTELWNEARAAKSNNVGEEPGTVSAGRGGPGQWRRGAVAAAVLVLFAAAGVWWGLTQDTASDRGEFRMPDRPSIAVLSLDTFSSEEEQRFLAEGIAEDIITQLARNSELTVMARTSTFSLRDKGLDAKEIADELDVHYILEGSVRRSGGMLRISAQLINAETGNHVWAERYDATAATIYSTQDEIVENIVGTLFSEIREAEKAEILRRPPSNLDVYELTLRGLARKHRLSPESMRLAREDLQRAVELDPEYAPAWLYLGWVEAIAIVFKWSDDLDVSDLDDAIGKVEMAIELDPMLATAYQALGLLRAYDGDAQGALEAAKRSVELGPGDADNLLFLGRAHASVGEFDQAIALTRHAIALNPSRPSYYDYYLSRSLWGRDEFEEVNMAANECLTKAPGFTACRVFQIVSHVGMGNADQAAQAVAALLERSPIFTVEDAVTSVGFPGHEKSNKRLAKQLIEAGLPTDKNATAIQ